MEQDDWRGSFKTHQGNIVTGKINLGDRVKGQRMKLMLGCCLVTRGKQVDASLRVLLGHGGADDAIAANLHPDGLVAVLEAVGDTRQGNVVAHETVAAAASVHHGIMVSGVLRL